MSWNFLYVCRDLFYRDHGPTWGDLYIRDGVQWQWLCYSYELPWRMDKLGHSLKRKSCIEEGTYEMHVRTGGAKGWRLELEGTGHRGNVQVHRAKASMGIAGCILPVHFNDFRKADLHHGDPVIERTSISLMCKIKSRYDHLKAVNHGKPKIVIVEGALP
jgi:hypothetical protein